jgi:uncharacterized protein YkwD
MNPFRLPLAAAAMLAILSTAALACSVPKGQRALLSEAIQLINAERARAGLARLSPSSELQTAAQNHACDSARRDKMGHRGSDGSTFDGRARKAGYRFSTINENVAYGYPTARQIVAGWMASPPHRRNILAARTRDIGMGLAQAASGTPHWVMVSGSR